MKKWFVFSILLLSVLAASAARRPRLFTLYSTPTIDTASLPVAIFTHDYSYQLQASGGSSPYTWSVTACSGACNTGFNLTSGGVFYGTPVNAGSSTFTFKVTDSSGNYATRNLTITIVPHVAIATSSMPQGQLGSAYSVQLQATGGMTPYTWSVVSCSGACNTGLGFTSGGLTSGTLANVGTSTFTYRVEDGLGHSSTVSLQIQVVDVSLHITTTSLPSGTVGEAYSGTLQATGGTPPYTWSAISCSGDCNTGLAIPNFATTGVLSGTPTGSGSSNFTFQVADSASHTATAVLNITIAPAATPISVTISPSSATLDASATQQFTATVTGTDNTAVVWTSTAGTISNSGLFTAPGAEATVTVTATSAADSTKYAVAVVYVADPQPEYPGTVYYVSTSGSNGSGCGTSQSNACATPDYAFNNRAGAGDTVLVAAGVYNYGNSAMTLSASGTSSAWKLLTCETRHACKITNSSGSGNSTTSVVEAQYTRIDGFEVTSSATTGHPNGFFVTVPHVKFTRNHIHDLMGNCHTSGYQNGGGGIQTYDTGLGVYDYEIDSNLFHDFDWPNVQACSDQGSVQSDAMLLEYTSGQIKVTNNIVYHSAGGWGIGIGSAGDTSNVLVANNLIFNNANGGVFFVMESGSNIAVVNNIIANNGAYGSFTSNCGVAYPYGMTFDFHNNNMYNNAGGTYCAEWGSGNQALQTGDKSENPANSFVNWLANGGGDYHLKSTSTLLDAGTSSHNPPSIDYDGKARFTGSAMDIGPYEY